MGPYILLGHGESEQGGAEKSSILCDIVESLIGATFVQYGVDKAREVVHHLVDDTLAEVATEGPALDWKTSLTVKAHEMGLPEPRYQMSVGGPEYALEFTAFAMLGDSKEVLGVGNGSSKRKAQLAAAEQAFGMCSTSVSMRRSPSASANAARWPTPEPHALRRMPCAAQPTPRSQHLTG